MEDLPILRRTEDGGKFHRTTGGGAGVFFRSDDTPEYGGGYLDSEARTNKDLLERLVVYPQNKRHTDPVRRKQRLAHATAPLSVMLGTYTHFSKNSKEGNSKANVGSLRILLLCSQSSRAN